MLCPTSTLVETEVREEKPRKEMEKVGGDSLLGREFFLEMGEMSLERMRQNFETV